MTKASDAPELEPIELAGPHERRALFAGICLTFPFVLASLGTNGFLGRCVWTIAICVSISGLLLPGFPTVATILVRLGIALGLGLNYRKLLDSPATTLAAIVIAVGGWKELNYRGGAVEHPRQLLTSAATLRGAIIGALGTLASSGIMRAKGGVTAGFVVVGIVLSLVLVWAVFSIHGDRLRRIGVVALTSVFTAYAYGLRHAPIGALTVLGTGLVVVLFFVRRISSDEDDLGTRVFSHPARLIVSTFFALCVLGTIPLAVPATAEEAPIALIDAAFTSVSAVCVTGLSVVDTETSFNFIGELFLVLLIQLGGLGIMAFYTIAFGVLGKRLSIRHEHAVASAQSIDQVNQLFRALGLLVGTTLVIETAGTLLLFFRFSRYEAPDPALWRAAFHAISGFCNAGFALQGDNLITYQTDPIVLHVIGALIVLGGLSPPVIASLPLFWGKRHRVTLQAKLGLSTTAVLLGIGFCAFLGFEWSNTLSHLSLVDKLHNAWFQSITPRTAGFNSVDMTQLSTPSRLLFIVLMFIGGGPGGTAGGIKTTTFAILTLAIIAALRGQSRVTAFGARLPLETVSRATAIATLGIGAVVFSTFALLLTQIQSFDGLLFEAVSALGTVGLSLGVTPKLDTIGKVIVMACMFAGRVGPLTLLLFLGSSARTDPNTLPERDVQVG